MDEYTFFLLAHGESTRVIQHLAVKNGHVDPQEIYETCGGKGGFTKHFYELIDDKAATHLVILQPMEGDVNRAIWFGEELIERDFIMLTFDGRNKHYKLFHCADCVVEAFNFLQENQEDWRAHGDKIAIHSYQ